MPTNQFSVFSAGPGANAMTPSAWAALTTLIASGFQPGVASSEQINTLLRQVSTVAAGTAKFASDLTGNDALDNGLPQSIADMLYAAVLNVVDARVRANGADPVGRLGEFPMATPPAGWLVCDGGSVLRSAYPALFSYLGGTYGAVDAAHFSLPDYRGLFLRGLDNGRGLDPGRVIGSYQADLFASHSHFDGDSGEFPGSTTGGGFAVINQAGHGTQTSTSASGGAETRPKNMAVQICIRAY